MIKLLPKSPIIKKLIFWLKWNYLRTSDFNTMYTTDCVNQIVCFIYDDYIPVKLYSTGFSGGLVEKDVIWQNNNLI